MAFENWVNSQVQLYIEMLRQELNDSDHNVTIENYKIIIVDNYLTLR